jgi:hypothetical protein
MHQVKQHATDREATRSGNGWERGLPRSHAADMGKSSRIERTGHMSNPAQTRQGVALSPSGEKTPGWPARRCTHQGGVWRPERGESDMRSSQRLRRTNPSDRHEQMNGRLVGKTFSLSKELRLLEAASCWEDALYKFTREVEDITSSR